MNSSNIAFDRTVNLMQDHCRLNFLKDEPSNAASFANPGFAPKEASFRQALRESMEAQRPIPVETKPKQIAKTGLREETQAPEIGENDSADLDDEMMKLSKNSVEYRFMATMLNKKLTMLKHAIGEGA